MFLINKKAESSIGTALSVVISVILAGLVLLGVVSLIDNQVAPAVAKTVTEQQTVPARDENVVERSYGLGDINMDGLVNNADLVYFKSYLDGETGDYTKINLSTADMNKDGKIDSKDYTVLKQTLERSGSTYQKMDLDKNGVVDDNDKLYLERYLAGWTGYENLDTDVADMNNDGVLSEADIEILKSRLGIV